jgi:fatty acid desaturase
VENPYNEAMASTRGARSSSAGARAAGGLWMLVWSWGPAVGAIALYARHPAVWTFALAFVVVAARQNALFVVAHESWHKNLFPWKRLNDFAGAWLASSPIVLPHWHSRHAHLEHHRTVGTAADPDRYAWGWTIRQRGAFVCNLLLVGTGLDFAHRVVRRLLRMPPPRPTPGRAPRVTFVVPEGRLDIIRIAIVHGALLGVFTATAGWPLYFALWLAPALSLRLAVDELRQFLEHRGGRLIIYRAGPIGRFVLGPFNFHLHALHHALAAEPWFRLPAIEERARSKDPQIIELPGYVRELVAYLRGIDSTAAPVTDAAPRDAEEPAS